jgi:uncharacterized membrane protein YeaQ/YmgE (transglycosylase-associated protein family)
MIRSGRWLCNIQFVGSENVAKKRWSTKLGRTGYRPDQGADFIGATVGALIVLFIWNRLVAARVISDPGAGPR